MSLHCNRNLTQTHNEPLSNALVVVLLFLLFILFRVFIYHLSILSGTLISIFSPKAHPLEEYLIWKDIRSVQLVYANNMRQTVLIFF